MQAVMSIDEVASMVPSTITWREPVEVGQVRGVEAGTSRATVESPRGRESPAHGSGHLSDGDTPASAKVGSRTRFYSSGSPGHGYGGLTSSSSTPNLSRDQDQANAITETTKIIGIQARLQEKPFVGGGVPDSVMMPSVTEGVSPGSPQVSRQTIRSRARPRRADEPAPFLSVDNLPVDKVIVEGKPHSKSRQSSDSPRKLTTAGKKRPDPLLNGAGRKTRSPPQSAYTPPVTRSPSRAQSRGTPCTTPYNYNSFFTHKSSAFLAGPPNLWSMGNKYWPQHGTPNDRQKLAPLPQSLAAETLAPKPNAHVSQPFKHDVNAEVPVDRPVSPSQDLKERTIYALREVTRVLNRQQSPPQSKKGGRLLKGRLKPLHTFKLSGPAIDNCKGIQPEEGDHGPSESRMLQRKRELLSMLPPDIFQPRPMTGESVHRTSVVSQLSTDRDKFLEEHVGQTQVGTEDEISKLSQVLSGARMPPNSLASLSDDNVSYLQDALTSHIDIPESPHDRDESQEENSETQEDHSRVNEISEAYATSYESGSKIDLSFQQVEEVSASGDAPVIEEKVQDEKAGEDKESSVKEEVKATMSDYMNEGGAARVLSDMVERVTNSAKKSTVGGDATLDQKYDNYFADSETRSDTPTSRTASSTLMRRQSSMTDIEMDQVSFELTDMVSEDGLGEDGSVKQAAKQSNAERGSLSSLSKAKVTIEGNKIANDDTECQSRDEVVTPTNEDFQKDTSSNSNLSENSVMDKLTQENSKNKDIRESTLYRYIDSGLVENEQNSITNFNTDADQVIPPAKEPIEELQQNGISKDTASDHRTVNDNGLEQNEEQKPTDTETGVSSADAKSEEKSLTTGSTIQVQANGNTDTTAGVETTENNSNSPISKEELVAANLEASVDIVTSVQIEVTEPESGTTSKEVPDVLVEQDADVIRQSSDAIISDSEQKSDDVKLAEVPVVDVATENKTIQINECNGERTGLPDDEYEIQAKEEDGNEDTQDDESSGCQGNGFKKDDTDQDGNQGGQGGGSHGHSSGSAGGNGGGSNTNGDSGNGNVQNDQPSGTGSTGGAQQRLYETSHTDNPADVELETVQRDPFMDDVNARLGDIASEGYDDIPDIDEPFLFCGICGLDEDVCLCPHSTFDKKLGSSGHTLKTKSASAVVNGKLSSTDASKRSYSAVEGLCDSERNRGQINSWCQEAEIEEESIQKHLILEYQSMIEKPRHKGFLSDELTSPRFSQGDYMILQGTGMKCASRQSSASKRPQSFLSEFEFRDHRTDHSLDGSRLCNGTDEPNDQLKMAGDSGCSSEMQSRVADQSEQSPKQSEALLTDKEIRDLNPVDKVDLHQSSPEAETLEVVAKPLPKPRFPKDTIFPAASVPAPLCFKINAKPPPGFLYYFAYGADMNKNRLTSYIGREADHRLWGVLFGFQLTFNKRGADLEAGGFPNIAFSPDSSVEGCVYLITPSELQKLDRHIGCPKFYTKAMFPVWMMNCAEPNELGVAQYCIPALTYVAQDKWTLSQEEKQLVESDYSVGQCLKGSDLLTPSYVQHISSLRVH
ncbi:uncharacterized protein LOC119720130 [Patiria miniata]|uniref:Gamma-glutamylcyclotransferase AIG2-like domain-containing protein n=1 Tax=Patiria miniata TaxID=46514 RepID=A0A913Z1B6_PATMI|nr:uncharacterized protein LOC119720130 [Patiria miniata]